MIKDILSEGKEIKNDNFKKIMDKFFKDAKIRISKDKHISFEIKDDVNISEVVREADKLNVDVWVLADKGNTTIQLEER